MKKVALMLVGLVVGVGGGVALIRSGVLAQFPFMPQQAAESPEPIANDHQEFHQHIDLRVVVEGEPLDLSKSEYQSSTYVYRDEHIHLHDNNGQVVHLHEPGVTLGKFLSTLDIELTDECLTVYKTTEPSMLMPSPSPTAQPSETNPPERPVSQQHCKADSGQTLVVMVNGSQQLEAADYEFKDLDKVLVYFGSPEQSQISEQMALVSDDACLYSETCPERGKPPVENCTASADTPCVVPQSQPDSAN